MKTNIILRVEIILPYLAALMFFMMSKLQFSSAWYFIFAALMALYFFPLRLLIHAITKEKTLKDRIVFFLSSVLISIILALSAIYSFADSIEILRIILIIFCILNFLFLVYYFIMDKNISFLILHVGIAVLAVVML